MPRVLVVGGSDAGISAALRAREVSPGWEVTVLVADAFPNHSVCGLPFFLSGEVSDWRALAHRTIEDLEGAGLQLLLDHTATRLEFASQSVLAVHAGTERALPYDRLVIATGAEPMRPPIPGLELSGVHTLHTLADAFGLHHQLATSDTRSAVVVGSGYIGMEVADALTLRGLQVCVLGRSPSVLPTLDPDLGRRLVAELKRHGVEVLNGVEVEAIGREGAQLVVRGSGGVRRAADLVLVAAGVRPRAALGAAAGLPTGLKGALRVDRQMATPVPGVYAAGDCVETWHRVLERPTYLPLGTTAHKQGRVAGENAVGGHRAFAGSVGTQVV